MKKVTRRFEAILKKTLRLISFIMFVIMIVIVFAQVLLRYFFGAPLAWSDELARLMLTWVSFLGVTLVHYSDAGHPAVTFIVDKFPPKYRNAVDIFLNVMEAVCFFAIAKAGLAYTIANHRFVSAVLHFPNSIKYAVLPLSMFLMGVKSITRAVEITDKLARK